MGLERDTHEKKNFDWQKNGWNGRKKNLAGRDELVILLITIELYSCTHTLSSHTD